MIAVTVCYQSNVAMKEDYYLATHMPMVANHLSPLGLRRTEVRKVAATASGAPSPYQVITSLYFDNLEAFQAATRTPAFKQVVDDIPNFYEGQPDILISQVVQGS